MFTFSSCFASIYSECFWALAITAWLLWFLMLFRNQLSVLACRQTRFNVDREQLYWSRKTCKALPILCSWFLMTYFALLFAVEMQTLWVAILYVVLVVMFGPMIFVLHTFNHTAVSAVGSDSLLLAD